MQSATFKYFLLGKPIATRKLQHQRLPKWKALAVLSSDALSSVAYATEEILIPLAAVAAVATIWSIPVAVAIAALLFIVTLSYHQTIDAYPCGGGAYTVAKENLGTIPSLVAAASLLIDYILTVSVSVSAGVENIASAFPTVGEHKVALGVTVIATLMTLNLRGVKEAGTLFALPTYFFVVSFLLMISKGFWDIALGISLPTPPTFAAEAFPSIYWLVVIRAFSSGCTALTGIEAISNGVTLFRLPTQRNAKITLMWMATILASFFLSLTFLTYYFGILPTPGHTTISMLAGAIFGQTFMYFCVQISIALILFLAANTSYADFPRLSSLLANDSYLPKQFSDLGNRLVFSNGIIGLSAIAAFLIVIFRGSTHHLIPLYAIGVFLSFTLSQAGMVVHHLRTPPHIWKPALFFNAIGALSTAVVLVVIASTKFMHGAWIVVLLIPAFVFAFRGIHRHYAEVERQLTLSLGEPRILEKPFKNLVILPVSHPNRGVIEAIHYAKAISTDIRACYVNSTGRERAAIQSEWSSVLQDIPLDIVRSPHRAIIGPLVRHINNTRHTSHSAIATVVIPQRVASKWWHNILHHHKAFLIRLVLTLNPHTVVISVPYRLESDPVSPLPK